MGGVEVMQESGQIIRQPQPRSNGGDYKGIPPKSRSSQGLKLYQLFNSMCNSLLMFVSTEQTRAHAHIHMRTQNDGFQPLQFSTHGEHASKPTCGDV